MAVEAIPSVATRSATGRLTAAVSGVARWAILLGLAAVIVIPILYAALGGFRDNYRLGESRRAACDPVDHLELH